MNKTKFSKTRKSIIAALCALTVTCTGVAAACGGNDNGGDDSSSKPQREDTQLLKNGNFEYFTVPDDAVYLIRNVTDWSRSGDSSGTMSGIINTSDKAWELMTADDLKDKLDANNDLSKSDPDYDDLYVDYNGMDSGDILYKEPYAATLDAADISDEENIVSKRFNSFAEFLGISKSDDDYYIDVNKNGAFDEGDKRVYPGADEADNDFYFDEERTQPVRYEKIANPETHLGEHVEVDGQHYLGGADGTKIYLDDDGNYFLDEDLKDSVGNVLMIHNFPTNRLYNGIEQHYSSRTLNLEANTAAEISLWVKTSDLKFDKGASQLNDQDRGAYVEVVQTVGSTTIDSFIIKAINTEKIIADNPDLGGNNGWLKYTIYINACDFANSTIQINLGLGDSSNAQKVTGYAFFDDVEVKKYIDLDESETYADHKAEFEGETNVPACYLTTEEDDKIFFADRQTKKGRENDVRFSRNFYYYIDLAASDIEGKTSVAFADATEKSVKLTSEKSGSKTYTSALPIESDGKYISGAKVQGMTDVTVGGTVLPTGWNDSKDTLNDLIGIFDSNKTFSESDFNSGLKNYSALLADLTNEKGIASLEKFVGTKGVNDMVVMLSAYGAAYTTTISHPEFTLAPDSYKILSFWVKTSDMDGKVGATLKIVDAQDDDVSSVFTIDSTGITTDVGDNKNIYNDWVQCFFFVHNDDEDNSKTFNIEFSIGNTTIAGTSYTNYAQGYVAMANMQILDKIDSDVFELVSESDYAKMLTLGEKEDDDNPTPFDEATGTSDIKSAVANSSKYDGVNGGSIFTKNKEYQAEFDRQNYNRTATESGFVNNAGLINRDHYVDYENYEDILRAFGGSSYLTALENWNRVFGEDCYQPLIIINTLREYFDRVEANSTNYRNYFVKDDDGNYVPATDWSENETYYARNEVVNYGFIGDSQTVSADSYVTVSVKVLVTGGATAHVYLVDTSTRKPLSFGVPQYTFYYDEEGNVLSEEYNEDWTDSQHRNAIVYKLREDGLYDGNVDGEKGVFANLYNLTKDYKYAKFEHSTYYDADGNQVSFDDLVAGETYYNKPEAIAENIASHYLVVNEQRIYEYDATTQTYYYLVDGARDEVVKPFNTDYARYTTAPNLGEYSVEIGNTHGKWVTVNFVIHTGNQSKQYRLELWSGNRESTGTDNFQEGGVAFDYSSFTVNDSNFANILAEYEGNVKDAYKKLLQDNNALDKLTSNDATITELEKAVAGLELDESVITAALEAAGCSEYVAQYYTFTLYDSSEFIPFNKLTAEEGATGYDYKITDYSESLAYFSYKNAKDGSYNTFVDYSTVDQTVEINDSHDHDHDHGDLPTTGDSAWLLITSIILTVVILFALCAIIVRDLLKRHRARTARKSQEKNNYKQRERYIRKLGLVKAAEVEETPAPAETPAEETEVAPEAPAEAPAEEAPEASAAEEVTEPETTEEPVETPAEETEAAPEAPAETSSEEADDKKDE